VSTPPDFEAQMAHEIAGFMTGSMLAPLSLNAAVAGFQKTHGRWPATESELNAATPLEADGRPLFRSLVFVEDTPGVLLVVYQTSYGTTGVVRVREPPPPPPQTQPTSRPGGMVEKSDAVVR
jgi:hypothetical protein